MPKLTNENQYCVVQGEDRLLKFRLPADPESLDPFDLTSVTEIEVRFPGVSGTVSKLMSDTDVVVLSPVTNGEITVMLPDASTLLLNPGRMQDVEVLVDKSAVRRIFILKQVLTVQEQPLAAPSA